MVPLTVLLCSVQESTAFDPFLHTEWVCFEAGAAAAFLRLLVPPYIMFVLRTILITNQLYMFYSPILFVVHITWEGWYGLPPRCS